MGRSTSFFLWSPGALAGALLILSAGPARAADMPQTGLLTAYANLDLVAADGPRAWLDQGGTGKARFGNPKSDALRLRPYGTEAGIVLQPDFGWSLSGLVSAVAQHGQDKAIDLNEAYLRWRPLPIDGVRATVRAGLFWPSVSLEHGGGHGDRHPIGDQQLDRRGGEGRRS
jgi:hypothetical protein